MFLSRLIPRTARIRESARPERLPAAIRASALDRGNHENEQACLTDDQVEELLQWAALDELRHLR